MNNNIENDRSVTSGKMYPIDLAPQKITIVKGMPNTEVKMAHLIPGQPKTTSSSPLITHGSMGSLGVMRTAAQIISPSVATQPQVIVTGPTILQGTTQILSQGSQIITQGSQIINQPQMLSSGQLLSPNTQIISQGTQLSAPVSNTNNTVPSLQVSNGSGNGTQLLNVGAGLVSGAGNLVVSSSVRALPQSVRVLPPLPQAITHHNTRPVLSNVNVSNAGGLLVSKGATSHVPRGLAAGASLAVRPVANPAASAAQGGAWSRGAGRGALVYGCRARSPAPPAPPTAVLTSGGVISSSVRVSTPTPPPTNTTSRPLPLLQRNNYQPAKVVGAAGAGVRGAVGNSAPPQLYYEVPRPAPHPHPHPPLARPLTPFGLPHTQPVPVSAVNTVQIQPETRQIVSSVQNSAILPRPSILRKRDIDGSPSKAGVGLVAGVGYAGGGWEDVPTGGGSGSTTVSCASSPAREPEPRAPDLSPRKKPRKQVLSNDVRQCEFPPEDRPPTPPPVVAVPPLPKRPSLSMAYVHTYAHGWRSTALHFLRPADVRRREPRARDLRAIAGQRHVLASADGWKVHHLTAQMDDLCVWRRRRQPLLALPRARTGLLRTAPWTRALRTLNQVSLEADVGNQLAVVLRALENASGRAHAAIQPLSHTLLELIKGNIQRSKIVCEGIQEAREDILRVFKHRNFVSDILTRQADKRCFRKHRSQS